MNANPVENAGILQSLTSATELTRSPNTARIMTTAEPVNLDETANFHRGRRAGAEILSMGPQRKVTHSILWPLVLKAIRRKQKRPPLEYSTSTQSKCDSS